MISKVWDLTAISYEVRVPGREYVDYMPIEDPYEFVNN
jgi:hypothetical protein